MENAIIEKTVIYDDKGSLFINKKGTKYQLEYCPFCGELLEGNTAKFKSRLFGVIGISIIISGANQAIRTYCLSINDAVHPELVHKCLVYTAVPSYIAGILIIMAGVAVLFFDRILVWFARGDR